MVDGSSFGVSLETQALNDLLSGVAQKPDGLLEILGTLLFQASDFFNGLFCVSLPVGVDEHKVDRHAIILLDFNLARLQFRVLKQPSTHHNPGVTPRRVGVEVFFHQVRVFQDLRGRGVAN